MVNLRFAAALVMAALALTASEPQRLVVAIVRLDGTIVPFAAFDDGRWQPAWPQADEGTEGVPTIDGTKSVWSSRGERVPRAWTVWPANASRPIQTQVTGIQVAEAHCGRQIVLKTDLRPIERANLGKLGVAVDSKLPITSIEQIRESETHWRSAEQVVIANFAKLETAKAQSDRQGLPRETPQPVARIAALYRESKTIRSPMYFVAEKKYRTPSSPQDSSCGRTTIVTGWLVPAEDDTLTLRDAKVFLTDCDEKELRRALPLAVVHLSNRLFWVLLEHGYEDEMYLIAEIGSTGVRYPVEMNGGGC